jgi:hypothetical protein
MNRKSELCQKGRQLGKYRAVVDLAEAIRYDLGNDICAYSEKELENRNVYIQDITTSQCNLTSNT